MNIGKNIIRVFCANFFQLISSVVVNFFVPAVLSIDDYAVLRTYMLINTYVGFTHFGFIDGMYIKYGGLGAGDVCKEEIKAEHHVFVCEQLLLAFGCAIAGICFGQTIWLLVGIGLLPINCYSFHRMFFQATGQFDKYSKVSYVYTVVYLVLNAVLAILFKCEKPWLYCAAIVVAYLLASFIGEIDFGRQIRKVKACYNKALLNNVKVGIFILLGNLAVQMFYAIDQWFVKGTMQDTQFAYYSFAVSLINMVNVLISAITVTFYNFLAQKPEHKKVANIKTLLILFGTAISTAYFILVPIISYILPKYIPALEIIAITFSTFPYIIIINALFVNLYKVEKKEKLYMKQVVAMLGVAAALNLIAVITVNTMQAIALATTASFVIWFYYAMRHFSFLRASKREFIYLSFALIWFLVCSHLFAWYIGGILYVIGICIVGRGVLHEFLHSAINIVKNKMHGW